MANRRSTEEIIDILQSNLDNIEEWTAKGLTQKQIAGNLGLNESTFIKYKKMANTELSKDIKKRQAAGREVADMTLENTAFMAATGYERKVKKYIKVKKVDYLLGKKESEYEEMLEYEETVYYPPDVTLLIFMLKNRCGYVNEPKLLEIKKKEVEIAEKKVDATTW